MKDQESSFYHCGGPAKHVQSCFRAMKDRERSFHNCAWRSCEARTIPFKGQDRSGKQFSPLWMSCEDLETSIRDRKGLECNFFHRGYPVKLVQACLSAWYFGQSSYNHRRRP